MWMCTDNHSSTCTVGRDLELCARERIEWKCKESLGTINRAPVPSVVTWDCMLCLKEQNAFLEEFYECSTCVIRRDTEPCAIAVRDRITLHDSLEGALGVLEEAADAIRRRA